MGWKPDQIAVLKAEYGRGKTASEIGKILGKTRCSVIGKCWRLSLSTKSNQKKNNIKQVSRHQENATQSGKRTHRSKFITTLIGKDFPPERKITLEQLRDGDCRFPNGHPNLPYPEFNFCGRPSVENFSYCLAHLPIIYQPRNKKEDVLTKENELPKYIEKKIIKSA